MPPECDYANFMAEWKVRTYLGFDVIISNNVERFCIMTIDEMLKAITLKVTQLENTIEASQQRVLGLEKRAEGALGHTRYTWPLQGIIEAYSELKNEYLRTCKEKQEVVAQRDADAQYSEKLNTRLRHTRTSLDIVMQERDKAVCALNDSKTDLKQARETLAFERELNDGKNSVLRESASLWQRTAERHYKKNDIFKGYLVAATKGECNGESPQEVLDRAAAVE